MTEDPSASRRQFGRMDWSLVAGVVLAFVVIPAIILYFPPTDLSFRFAYLVLPTIPAIGLGVLAVWVAMNGD